VDKVLNSEDRENAMKVEMVALEKNKSLELVDLPKGKNLANVGWYALLDTR